MTRADIELDFVREFAHSGAQLGPSVSREERRERIRCAIVRENKQELRFRDTTLTYAQVYQLAYNKPLNAARVLLEGEPSNLLIGAVLSMEEEADESDDLLEALDAGNS